jgi:hypothetical protein
MFFFEQEFFSGIDISDFSDCSHSDNDQIQNQQNNSTPILTIQQMFSSYLPQNIPTGMQNGEFIDVVNDSYHILLDNVIYHSNQGKQNCESSCPPHFNLSHQLLLTKHLKVTGLPCFNQSNQQWELYSIPNPVISADIFNCEKNDNFISNFFQIQQKSVKNLNQNGENKNGKNDPLIDFFTNIQARTGSNLEVSSQDASVVKINEYLSILSVRIVSGEKNEKKNVDQQNVFVLPTISTTTLINSPLNSSIDGIINSLDNVIKDWDYYVFNMDNKKGQKNSKTTQKIYDQKTSTKPPSHSFLFDNIHIQYSSLLPLGYCMDLLVTGSILPVLDAMKEKKRKNKNENFDLLKPNLNNDGNINHHVVNNTYIDIIAMDNWWADFIGIFPFFNQIIHNIFSIFFEKKFNFFNHKIKINQNQKYKNDKFNQEIIFFLTLFFNFDSQNNFTFFTFDHFFHFILFFIDLLIKLPYYLITPTEQLLVLGIDIESWKGEYSCRGFNNVQKNNKTEIFFQKTNLPFFLELLLFELYSDLLMNVFTIDSLIGFLSNPILQYIAKTQHFVNSKNVPKNGNQSDDQNNGKKNHQQFISFFEQFIPSEHAISDSNHQSIVASVFNHINFIDIAHFIPNTPPILTPILTPIQKIIFKNSIFLSLNSNIFLENFFNLIFGQNNYFENFLIHSNRCLFRSQESLIDSIRVSSLFERVVVHANNVCLIDEAERKELEEGNSSWWGFLKFW